MNMISIRSPLLAALLSLASASCAAFDQGEGALSDEGCIIDVRPKPKLPSFQGRGVDHWVVIEYEPVDYKNDRIGIVFELPVADNYATATYAGLFTGANPTKLPNGTNTLTLEYKSGKVGFLLKDKNGKTLLDTYNDHAPPTSVSKAEPIEWPRAKELNDLNNLKVVRILIKGYGFETGFTLHAKDLLLEPRWKRVKKPWPGKVD